MRAFAFSLLVLSSCAPPARDPPAPPDAGVNWAGCLEQTSVFAPGRFLSCAACGEATTVCWAGSASAEIPFAGPVVDLAAGYGYACALTGDGAVQCTQFPRGDGLLNEAPAGTATRLLPKMRSPCAVLRGDVVRCWTGPHRPEDWELPSGAVVDAFGEPGAYGCAVVDATLICEENGAVTTLLDGAIAVDGFRDTGESGCITWDERRLCAATSDGAVHCAAGASAPLAVVPALDDAVDVVVEGGFGCALRASGHVACWGWGHDRSPPGPAADVPGIDDAVALRSSGNSLCAARRHGGSVCFSAQQGPR